MFIVGDVNENKVLKLSIEGRLTMEEYKASIAKCEALLKEHGSLRFYCELKNFAGSDMGTMWEGIKFDLAHRSQYGRSAIVGDKVWEEWATKFSGLFFQAPVRFFYVQDAKQAWEWVNQP